MATRVNVEMQVRNFLKCGWADRVPEAQALIGKSCRDSASHASYGRHQRRAGDWIRLAHIGKMLARNHQHMPGIELPKVNKGERQLIAVDDTRRRKALLDFTEDAGLAHRLFSLLIRRHKVIRKLGASKLSTT